MSSHKIEVVPVILERHPNADTLSVVRVYGWDCIVKTEQFANVSLAAFVIPDSIVDTSIPEFAFLREQNNKIYEKRRIKAAKYRGVPSQGLLIPARPHWKLGDDVADELKIEHYEPQMMHSGGPNAPRIKGLQAKTPVVDGVQVPVYTDIENFRRYNSAFDNIAVDVVATEKIHGANFRAVHDGKQLHVGSHRTWKLGDRYKSKIVCWVLSLSKHPGWKRIVAKVVGNRAMSINAADLDDFWRAAKRYGLEEKLSAHQGLVFYGELYGRVQKGFTYDSTTDDPLKIRFFDVMDHSNYLNYDKAKSIVNELGLDFVPEVYRGKWDKETLMALAEGKTTLGAKHIREGIVVKPVEETIVRGIGRLVLKIVGQGYLEKGE